MKPPMWAHHAMPPASGVSRNDQLPSMICTTNQKPAKNRGRNQEKDENDYRHDDADERIGMEIA